jgi:coenzyme F420 hydrogenase subunit beta
MSGKNISLVAENNLCTGCGACKVSCNVEAIRVSKTNIGRLFADIDTEICTNCGICLQICPGIDVNKQLLISNANPFEGIVKKTYTGISTNKLIYNNAQSGGLVTETLSYLFDTDQIDAAVVCVSNYGTPKPEVFPTIVTDKEQLLLSQRSSYTPVDMVSALKHTANYSNVAFVGLPCHIQGIVTLQAKFKRYKNIKYKFGLICDRAMSEVIADVLISETNAESCKKKIVWRDKRLGYKNAPVVIEYENGDRKKIPATKRHLLKDYFTSPRCRICFDKMNIHTDIVFGDPWGMSNIDWKCGESLVITRTDIGENLMQNLLKKKRVILKEASFDEMKKGQHLKQKASQIKTYFEVYRKNKWQLPYYADNLNLSTESSLPYNKCEKLILDYLNIERKDSSQIIKEIKCKMQRKIIKNKVLKTPFRVFKTVKKWIKKYTKLKYKLMEQIP